MPDLQQSIPTFEVEKLKKIYPSHVTASVQETMDRLLRQHGLHKDQQTKDDGGYGEN